MDGNYQRKKASEAAWSEEGLRSSKLQRGKNGLQKSIRRLLCSTIHARKWRNLGSILCRGCSLRDNFFMDARGKGEFSSLRERLDETRISLRKRNSRLRLTSWKNFLFQSELQERSPENICNIDETSVANELFTPSFVLDPGRNKTGFFQERRSFYCYRCTYFRQINL